MKRSKRKPFDYYYYTERNKQVALERYGDRIDTKGNIVGTNYYFDYFWRLREKGGD